MLNEDQYMERTLDLVAKVRQLREEAEERMNRFTRVADYDVHRVIGHGSKAAPISGETVTPLLAGERPNESAGKSAPDENSVGTAPASAAPRDEGEPS